MNGPGQHAEAAAWRGAAMAMAAASLFGLSTPLAKILLQRTDPLFLAGVLYLGSGVGLAVLRLASWRGRGMAREPAPAPGDWPWLAGAILSGGVIGPVLLLTGLALTGAGTASLLLNLETVFTALIACFAFRENLGRRIALGMLLIAGGAAVLLLQSPAGATGTALGPLAIAGACLAWAIDNNFTRKVSLADPVVIAMLKGLVAGTVNLGLAMALGTHPAATGGGGAILAGAALGMLGYGLSLVLFVRALREIGAARTGAYFASAPFIGALLAAALGEPVTARLLCAGALMLAGLWLHLTERHSHEHEHEPLVHAHRHRHDLHHRHDHGPADPAGEPHSHAHVHVRLRHSHRHFPDAHHSHSH